MSNRFITGVSRGFGKILAQEALAQGHTVVGTIRSGESDIAAWEKITLPTDFAA